jgi:hypothetical protein
MRNKIKLIQQPTDNFYDIARLHCEEETLFEWGKCDCILWVCDYIYKIHGVDHAKDYRGKYNSQLSARRIMRKLGADTIESLVDSYYKRVHITFAKRGDLILSPNKAMGICLGVYSHFLGAGGMIKIPTQQCLAAWSIK